MRDVREGGGMVGWKRQGGSDLRERSRRSCRLPCLNRGAGHVERALGFVWSPTFPQQLCLQDWDFGSKAQCSQGSVGMICCATPSYLQQAHQGGGEDDEAGQHV